MFGNYPDFKFSLTNVRKLIRSSHSIITCDGQLIDSTGNIYNNIKSVQGTYKLTKENILITDTKKVENVKKISGYYLHLTNGNELYRSFKKIADNVKYYSVGLNLLFIRTDNKRTLNDLAVDFDVIVSNFNYLVIEHNKLTVVGELAGKLTS